MFTAICRGDTPVTCRKKKRRQRIEFVHLEFPMEAIFKPLHYQK
jgi:hypothetical protein